MTLLQSVYSKDVLGCVLQFVNPSLNHHSVLSVLTRLKPLLRLWIQSYPFTSSVDFHPHIIRDYANEMWLNTNISLETKIECCRIELCDYPREEYPRYYNTGILGQVAYYWGLVHDCFEKAKQIPAMVVMLHGCVIQSIVICALNPASGNNTQCKLILPMLLDLWNNYLFLTCDDSYFKNVIKGCDQIASWCVRPFFEAMQRRCHSISINWWMCIYMTMFSTRNHQSLLLSFKIMRMAIAKH